MRRVLAITVALMLMPATAWANFGSTTCGGSPTNCVSLGNNKWHAVEFVSLGNNITGIDSAVQWALDNVYDPTDLVAYRDDSDPAPDVRVFDFNYGNNGLVGWAECPSTNTGTGGSHPLLWCRGQLLRFNEAYEATDFNTLTKRRTIACHELAHTVGLRHWDEYHSGNPSCTFSTPANGGSTGIEIAHERNSHINPWY